MLPLVIRSRPGGGDSFVPGFSVELPVAAETAGWVVPFGNECRLWINSPADQTTRQFRVSAAREIEELELLPLVAAGATACGGGFTVTGADGSGRPVVTATDAEGRLSWRHGISGPPPLRWPVPGCRDGPVVVWQVEQGSVEMAAVGASGVAKRESVHVGGPPLDLAVTANALWAVWSDARGISALEASGSGMRRFQISPRYASEIAVGACEGVCIAWAEGSVGYIAAEPFTEPRRFDLGAAAGGTLRIVPGAEPLVFASLGHVREDEPPWLLSVLTAPGLRPIEIEGTVHAVASRGEVVMLLGESRLQFLRRSPG